MTLVSLRSHFYKIATSKEWKHKQVLFKIKALILRDRIFVLGDLYQVGKSKPGAHCDEQATFDGFVCRCNFGYRNRGEGWMVSPEHFMTETRSYEKTSQHFQKESETGVRTNANWPGGSIYRAIFMNPSNYSQFETTRSWSNIIIGDDCPIAVLRHEATSVLTFTPYSSSHAKTMW